VLGSPGPVPAGAGVSAGSASSSTERAASAAAREASCGRRVLETPSQTTAAITPVSWRIPNAIASSLTAWTWPRSLTPATRPRSAATWSVPSGIRLPQSSQ
jgi:hypothetical protein